MEKEFLSRQGIRFVEKDVSRDPAASQELVRMGQRGVPVTLIDGQLVVGFNRPLLEQLLARSSAGQSEARPQLGAAIADAAKHAQPGSPPGAYVGRLKPGSAAERAGLQVGDIITQMAGQPVQNAAGVERLIARADRRAPFQIKVYRQGHTLDLLIQL